MDWIWKLCTGFSDMTVKWSYFWIDLKGPETEGFLMLIRTRVEFNTSDLVNDLMTYYKIKSFLCNKTENKIGPIKKHKITQQLLKRLCYKSNTITSPRQIIKIQIKTRNFQKFCAHRRRDKESRFNSEKSPSVKPISIKNLLLFI